MKNRIFPIIVVFLVAFAALSLIFSFAEKARASVYHQPVAMPDGESLTVTDVEPDSAPNDLDTDIRIGGSGFTFTVSGTQVISLPQVYLGDWMLDDVTWVSSATLSATLPWGLDLGTWPLTVFNPDGVSGTIAGAFTVTEGLDVWTTGGPYGGRVVQVAIHPITPTKIYAAAWPTGLFSSDDSGANWELILLNNWPLRVGFDALDPDVMYYGADSGDLYLTRNGGEIWENIQLFKSHNGCFSNYPVPHPEQPDVVFVGTGSCGDEIPIVPGEGGIFYSDDTGINWVTRTVGLTDTDVIDIAFHPDNGDHILVGTRAGNVFSSTNGGQLWEWIARIPTRLRRLYFNPFGAHEAWAVPEMPDESALPFLYQSVDLTTWITKEISGTYGSGQIWSLAFTSDTLWAAGARGYMSVDGGETYSDVLDTDQEAEGIRSFAFDPSDPGVIYAGDTSRGVVKSVDGGVTWVETNEGLADIQVRALTLPPDDPDTIYADTYELGLLKSNDGGRAWQALDIRSGGAPRGFGVAVDPFTSTRVYYNGNCSSVDPCLWISPDSGASWREVTMTLPVTSAGWTGELNTVAPHPLVTGTLFVGASFYTDGAEPSGIYKSGDFGESWEFITPTQSFSEVSGFVFDWIDPDLVYATSNGSGLLRSEDGGDTWEMIELPGVLSPVVVAPVDIATHPGYAGGIYLRASSLALINPEPVFMFSLDGGDNWTELPHVQSAVAMLFTPPLVGEPRYTLHIGCGHGMCESTDGGHTFQEVPGVPRPELMVAGSDGERVVIYIGTPGGIASPVQHLAQPIPGQGDLIAGGIYRLTSVIVDYFWAYLPFIIR